MARRRQQEREIDRRMQGATASLTVDPFDGTSDAFGLRHAWIRAHFRKLPTAAEYGKRLVLLLLAIGLTVATAVAVVLLGFKDDLKFDDSIIEGHTATPASLVLLLSLVCVVLLFCLVALPIEILITATLLVSPSPNDVAFVVCLTGVAQPLIRAAAGDWRRLTAGLRHQAPDWREPAKMFGKRVLGILLIPLIVAALVDLAANGIDMWLSARHETDKVYVSAVVVCLLFGIALYASDVRYGRPLYRQAVIDDRAADDAWRVFRERRAYGLDLVWTLVPVGAAFTPAALKSSWLPLTGFTAVSLALVVPRVRRWSHELEGGPSASSLQSKKQRPSSDSRARRWRARLR